MGQTLLSPVTNKATVVLANNLYQLGSSCMQGWRTKMEDAHTHNLSLPEDPGTAFFAVYDGHGGESIAKYAKDKLHNIIIKQSKYKEGNIIVALKEAYLEIDDIMLHDEKLKKNRVGCTAVTIVIKGDILYCANVGDSRAVACVSTKLNRLSYDHKPKNATEYQRIINAGGWVEANRVNGMLALSRALGDFQFKKNASAKNHIVTAYPDVETRKITEDWEFLVIACDGIWDVMTSQQVIDFVRKHIGAGMKPEEICERLMMHCLAPRVVATGVGCDNMTVIIVCFLHNKPYETLVQKFATPKPIHPSAPNINVNSQFNSNTHHPELLGIDSMQEEVEETVRKLLEEGQFYY